MKPIKKILFPTDFSETARNAFRYALVYAGKTGASIRLLHVVLPEYEALDLPVMAAQATQERIKAAKEVLKDFVDYGIAQVQAAEEIDFQLPEIRSSVEIGGVADVIQSINRRDDYDLVVMGTKGEHNRFEKIFGSVSASVIANSDAHVLVVPEDARLSGIKAMAFATDLNNTDPYSIWKSVHIMEPWHPVLHCVHVHTGKDKGEINLTELEEFFADRSPSVQIRFTEIEGKSVSEALNDFVETYEIDLLAMVSPSRTFLERIFHDSVSRKMALRCKVPLLVVRP